jgi:hypothetical protein
MIKATIINNGKELDFHQGPSEQFLREFLAPFEASGVYGKPAYSYQNELTPAVFEEQEVLNEQNESFDPPRFEQVEIVPATFETINVPAEYEIVFTDITAELAEQNEQKSKIEAGKKAREVCQKVLDLVAGENLDKELTVNQITQLQSMFSNAEAALRAGRPGFAKSFISAITPDEVLVSSSLKAQCLELLADY